MRSVPRKLLIGAACALLALLVITIGTMWTLLGTNTGTRWALRLAQQLSPGELVIERTVGSLSGPLLLEDLHYRDPAAGIDVRVDRLQVDLAMRSLWRLKVHVLDLDVQGVAVALTSVPQSQEPQPSEPFTLDAPVDLRFDSFRLSRASIESDGEPLVAIDAAALSGTWIDTTLRIDQLDLRSPQGEVHLRANARGGDTYIGDADGRFRWEAAGRTYAGTVSINAGSPIVAMTAKLSAPATATVDVELEQRDTLPWTLRLEVPRFDPRESLLEDGSLQAMAVALHGSGDRTHAALEGEIGINDEVLTIERLHAQLSDQIVTLAMALRPPRGRVELDGTIARQDPPATVRLTMDWDDVVIPAAWAGQVLQTQGAIKLEGNAQRYDTSGALRIGPPQRVASIDFELQGTPDRIDLQRFDILQKSGQVRVRGGVELRPLVAWQLEATANGFDPSEFMVAWPGNLDFDLQTQGRLPPSGPEARLQLANFSGDLRGQALSGSADLTLDADRVLAGTLDMTAGENRLRLRGKPGNRIDAQARLDVPSLASLAPQFQGAIHADVAATGIWPHLRTSGALHARSLRLDPVQVKRLDVEFAVDEPLDPRGQVTVDGEQLTLGDLSFAAVSATAEGSARKHSLQVQADGERLSGTIALRGSQVDTNGGTGWSGHLERLQLAMAGAPELTLQQSVDIDYAPPQVRLSQACLAGTDLRLCLRGSMAAAGAFDVEYSLQNLPLALANSAMPTLPVTLSGSIDGEGHLQRDASAVLNGRASLQSAHGAIARLLQTQPDAPQVLLTYDQLRVQVQLQNRQARAEISAQLDESGQLRGKGVLQEAGTAAASIRGELAANLPSISVVEAFVPQLANLQGDMSLRAQVSGSLDAPVIDGEARIASLSADLPMLGLKLRDGGLRVTPRSNGSYALDGSISSGDGTLRLDGNAMLPGTAQLAVRGERFLAADIPGARVIVEPDLQFALEAERMSLTGKLHVPSADINVQKLPRGQSTQSASEDVVVVDARTRADEEQEQIPLHAAVDVTLGDAVSLTGFGLDASVRGQLQVRESPGQPTTGSGEVRVSGTYKAYGQDLTIRQGHLLFAGTPLDNPRLSIVAVREVEPVVAGLKVEGSAQNPQLTVFSEPTLSQSNALSYLVAGKPMNEIGEGEGDAVQSAARALGTAAGGLLAKNVGRRLGVDELGIQDSEAIGGSALTIGQYLSPRLYLSYGVGLFEPGEVITLRYKLSHSVTFEALNGPIDSRAGVEYRMEK